jgi:cytochrome P450
MECALGWTIVRLFPIEFIAQMLGVPPEQRQQIRHWVDTTLEREIGSMEVPESGKPVFLVGASANRDPAAFTDADVFDIDRDRAEAQNLALGYGVHSCLGAALARMETRIALEKLLDFMPRYEVHREGLKSVVMINASGWSHVPVRVQR